VEATQAHITVDTESNDIMALGGTDTALATAGIASDILGGFFCRFQFRVVTELPGSFVQIGRESLNRVGGGKVVFPPMGNLRSTSSKDAGLTGSREKGSYPLKGVPGT
jgi:hypothetical protein